MKCRIIVDGKKGPGDAPGTERDVPRGTEIEHPDAWMLCLPDGGFVMNLKGEPVPRPQIIAEPADEECQARVDEEMKLINFIKTGNK